MLDFMLNTSLIEFMNTVFFLCKALNLCYPRTADVKLLKLHRLQCFSEWEFKQHKSTQKTGTLDEIMTVPWIHKQLKSIIRNLHECCQYSSE